MAEPQMLVARGMRGFRELSTVEVQDEANTVPLLQAAGYTSKSLLNSTMSTHVTRMEIGDAEHVTREKPEDAYRS
jgi:hypothetical protein